MNPIIPPSEPTVKENGFTALQTPEGKTVLDTQTRIDIDLLSYRVLESALEDVASSVKEQDGQGIRLVYVDGPLARAMDYYDGLRVQVTVLQAAFRRAQEMAERGEDELTRLQREGSARLRRKKGAFPLLDAGTVLAGAVNVLSAFRQDVEYFGREVKLDPIAVAAVCFRRLSESIPNTEIFSPALFLVSPVATTANPEGIVQELRELIDMREKARLGLMTFASSVQSLPAEDEKLRLARPALDAARDQFEAADSALRGIETSLTFEYGKDEMTLLQLVRRVEILSAWLQSGQPQKTYLLRVHIAAAGGYYRTVRHLFRNLFTGDGLSCAAGIVTVWTLADADGKVVDSGVQTKRAVLRSLSDEVDRSELLRIAGVLLALMCAFLAGIYFR